MFKRKEIKQTRKNTIRFKRTLVKTVAAAMSLIVTFSVITPIGIPITTGADNIFNNTKKFSAGDVDGDGKITINDALEILMYLAGMNNSVILKMGEGSPQWNAAMIDSTAKKPTIGNALKILIHLSEESKKSKEGELYSLSDEVLKLTNAERVKQGLPALKKGSDNLIKAAMLRAKETIELFSHTRPNGESCFTTLDEYSVKYFAAGENIAYGQPTPDAVVKAWMNSDGHRDNILNSDFTHLGVGVAEVGGTMYWAQMFIGEP